MSLTPQAIQLIAAPLKKNAFAHIALEFQTFKNLYAAFVEYKICTIEDAEIVISAVRTKLQGEARIPGNKSTLVTLNKDDKDLLLVLGTLLPKVEIKNYDISQPVTKETTKGNIFRNQLNPLKPKIQIDVNERLLDDYADNIPKVAHLNISRAKLLLLANTSSVVTFDEKSIYKPTPKKAPQESINEFQSQQLPAQITEQKNPEEKLHVQNTAAENAANTFKEPTRQFISKTTKRSFASYISEKKNPEEKSQDKVTAVTDAESKFKEPQQKWTLQAQKSQFLQTFIRNEIRPRRADFPIPPANAGFVR